MKLLAFALVLAYVTNERNGTIMVINTETTIKAGDGPWGIAIQRH